MKFTHAYTPPGQRVRRATKNTEPSLCEESHATETDINVIMSRYERTGQLPQVLGQPLFGDFTEMPDYRQAVTQIRQAEEAFLEVPAKVRALFGNDPAEFIKFCSDPGNKAELEKLGLTRAPPDPSIEEELLQAVKDLKPPPPQGGTPKAANSGSPSV